MQSISENDFECLASTGVNAPETMFPSQRFVNSTTSWRLFFLDLRFLLPDKAVLRSRIIQDVTNQHRGIRPASRFCTFDIVNRLP